MRKFRALTFLSRWTFAIAAALLGEASLSADEDRTPFVASAVKYSREFALKNHLLAFASLTPPTGEATDYQLDRYPEVTRIKMSDGAVYAKRTAGKWLRSDDWGKTGKPVRKDKAAELDALVGFVDVPMRAVTESRDQSQGGNIMRLVKTFQDEDGERFLIESTRENAKPGNIYPLYGFEHFKNSPEGEVLLRSFNGPIYSGSDIVLASVKYDYLVAMPANVQVTIVPSGPNTDETKHEAPAEDRIYGFEEIEKRKFELAGKVVKVSIRNMVLQTEPWEKGMERLLVRDTTTDKAYYGMVLMPTNGREKLSLGEGSEDESVTFHVMVTPVGKKPAAQLTVVGSLMVKRNDGMVSYVW